MNKPQQAAVKIIFTNRIHHQPLVLFDSSYRNPYGELYSLNKFKYYISNTSFSCDGKTLHLQGDYHLINQAVDSSLNFTVDLPPAQYDGIGFLLGVDSVMNTAGAQTGALDPINEMYWTWNSGYIMEKIEGTSPQSNAAHHKLEYHIGGFGGENSVLNYLMLPFPVNKKLDARAGSFTEIYIEVDLDKIWDAATPIKIAEIPVCSLPGPVAKKIASNFSKLFSIGDIISKK